MDILGDHFGTSEPPRGAIVTPRHKHERPWEQQDGFEVVVCRILLDLGVLLGLCFESFLGTEARTLKVPQRAKSTQISQKIEFVLEIVGSKGNPKVSVFPDGSPRYPK